MAVTTTTPAPYATAQTIVDFIRRYRDRGLATPFNAEVLARAGVSDSLIPRTLQSLVSLELMNDEGQPTETLEGLRRVAEPEFKTRMAAWISAVYADVLSFVNASDDEAAIRDAFRAFNPVGQQPRMVSLFIGLCREAGMRADDQPIEGPRPKPRKPFPAGAARSTRKSSLPVANPPAQLQMGGLPTPIAGLLTKLPPEHGTWTKAERDRFENAFKALLDYCFTEVEKKPEEIK